MAIGIDGRGPQSGAPTGPRAELLPEEIPLLADYVMSKLEEMGKDHPYLSEDQEYKSIKTELRDEGITPSDEAGFILGTIYVDLILYLQKLREGTQNVVSFQSSKKEVKKIPDGYLPITFDDLKNNFNQAIQPEHIGNALTAAAESMIMGELEGGIQRIIPKYRESVKDEIIEVFTRSSEEEDDDIRRVINKFKMDNLLAFLFQDEESLRSTVDHQHEDIAVRIARIILQVVVCI